MQVFLLIVGIYTQVARRPCAVRLCLLLRIRPVLCRVLLQLPRPAAAQLAHNNPIDTSRVLYALPAGIPPLRFGPARPRLALGAELPGHGHNRRHDRAGNDGVALPVRGLGIPTTGR